MNYQTLRDNSSYWQPYTQHDFVQKMGDGTLEHVCFQHYLKQDYLFLIQFTRAWALAIYKSDNFEQMRIGQAGINAMLDTEIKLHIDYCKDWDIPEAQVLSTPESPACVAYTRYVLDVGMTGSLVELLAALAPCVIGYAEIGKSLADLPAVADNAYQSWIDMYASPEYQQAAKDFQQLFDDLCKTLSAAQTQKLQKIFDTATHMEVAFWQMGLALN